MINIKKKLVEIFSSTIKKNMNKIYTDKRPREVVRCIWNLEVEA